MKEYKYDEESVNALIEWTKTASFPEQVMLSEAENIFDSEKVCTGQSERYSRSLSG